MGRMGTSRGTGDAVARRLKAHGLLLVNLLLFVIFLSGMASAGWQVAGADALEHGIAPPGFGSYLVSGEFVEAVFENWESEFLQMGSYVVLTVFLFQRGSAESKPVDRSDPRDEDPRRHRDDPRAPWPVRHGGFVLVLYENSLLLLFAVLFIASFLLHLAGGAAAFSEEQLEHGGSAVTPWEYLGSAQFWFESLQNWQSEFFVVALLVGASVFLRQRGSGESKPVAAPHADSG